MKTIFKFFGITLLLSILSLNVVITGNTLNETEVMIKTQEANAHIEPEIACHSSSKINLAYSYTDCSTCNNRNFRRGIGTESTCIP